MKLSIYKISYLSLKGITLFVLRSPMGMLGRCLSDGLVRCF